MICVYMNFTRKVLAHNNQDGMELVPGSIK
jgi:hypothetical protein